MDFAEFVKKMYRDKHDAFQASALQRLGRALNRTMSIGPLLEKNDPALEPFRASDLGLLADAYREYLRWTETAKSLRRHLATNKLDLPDGSRDTAFTPSELEALKRTASICQRSGYRDHDAWAAAVEAHVELWRTSVNLSLAHGSAVVKVSNPEHPDVAEFEGHVTARAILSEIPGYKWLAIRRGVRAEILEVKLEIPLKEIRRQTEARLPLLGLVAEKRGFEAITMDLIERDVEQVVLDLLDETAEKEALSSARMAYMGLLNTPPLQVDKILSGYVGDIGSPIGLAVLDKKGDVLEQKELEAFEGLQETLKKLCGDYELSTAVLPVTSEDKDAMGRLEQALGTLSVHRVLSSAIKEASKNLPFDRMASRAVVLGRRALKPGREWGRVNPLSLNLGEYPRELDAEKLSLVLSEARQLSSWDRRIKNHSANRGGGTSRAVRTQIVGKKLNPLVKTIRDLRPEMTVDGIVTNITRFGAFVNIGLSTEGMIHVSQLSVDFVDDPSQVVRVGQQVQARVLEVIPEKDRIALSLKPTLERSSKESGGLPAFQNGTGPEKKQRQAPKTRSAALADLDALFRK